MIYWKKYEVFVDIRKYPMQKMLCFFYQKTKWSKQKSDILTKIQLLAESKIMDIFEMILLITVSVFVLSYRKEIQEVGFEVLKTSLLSVKESLAYYIMVKIPLCWKTRSGDWLETEIFFYTIDIQKWYALANFVFFISLQFLSFIVAP